MINELDITDYFFGLFSHSHHLRFNFNFTPHQCECINNGLEIFAEIKRIILCEQRKVHIFTEAL